MKKLPIGISTFTDLQHESVMYVDKTEYIYNLLQQGKGRYFLSRPRRFGKSLTCSTLDTIFSGKKELFSNLWIGQSDYAWVARPVLRFDFSSIDHKNADVLEQALHSALDAHASRFNVALTEKLLQRKFSQLVVRIGESHGPLAIIIDEYDKPIVDLITHLDEARRSSSVLRDFYGVLKSNDVDANVHFLFVTGVSKFAKISLFSELNNLQDLTLDERYAALVGYTQQEVEENFTEHITQFSNEKKCSYQEMLTQLRHWYNGFRFSEADVTVYNPFSLHNCLDAKRFANYWFASGTPKFLINIFTKEPAVVKDFINQPAWKISGSDMETFAPEVFYKKIIPLLLQTGYLTIKSYSELADIYVLDYPNREVRLAMTEQVMELVANVSSVQS